MSEQLLPGFSSRSNMVSGLIFRFFMNFEFIFVYDERKWSGFILLQVAAQLPQYHLMKRWSFPIMYSCLHCHELIDHRSVGLFLDPLFCSLDLCVYFCVHTVLFWLPQLRSVSWCLGLWCFQLCSSISRLLWQFRVFCLRCRF